MKRGVLPDRRINELIDSGFIVGAKSENTSSDRLDLTFSDECYCLMAVCVPRRKEPVSELIKRFALYAHSFHGPLEPGIPYIVKLNESFSLPEDVKTVASSKSSAGRVFFHARLLGDYGGTFDRLPSGYNGGLWALVVPKVFPIMIEPGISVLQTRFYYGNPRLTREELVSVYSRHPFLWMPDGSPLDMNYITLDDEDGGFLVRLDLEGDIAAWRANGARANVFDFSVPPRTYNPEDFFEVIERPKSGLLLLDTNSGYLFSSYEGVSFTEEYCGEVDAFDIGIGDIRLHYAGFFDAGFGYGVNGSVKGTPATLEVMVHEDRMLFTHKQRILKFFVYRMYEKPDMVYGHPALNSSYLYQRGPRLPKQFKQVS